MTAPEIDEAQRDADAARAQLMGTVHLLQERLKPSTIATDIVADIRARGYAAVALVKARPVASAAIVGGLFAFVARKPLLALFHRARKTPAPRRGRTGDRT